jgi:hypothetical protein
MTKKRWCESTTAQTANAISAERSYLSLTTGRVLVEHLGKLTTPWLGPIRVVGISIIYTLLASRAIEGSRMA